MAILSTLNYHNVAAPANSQANATNPKVKELKYGKWDTEDFVKQAVLFYSLPAGCDLTACCHKKKVPFTTFKRHLKACGIFEMKKQGRPVADAIVALREQLIKKNENTAKRVMLANTAKRYLTDMEELCVVKQCQILAACGRGISVDELLEMINAYVHRNTDPREIHPISMKTVRGFLGRHQDKLKIIQSSSMDPKRAAAANEETRDAMFVKAESFVNTLHAMGKVPWESMQDVPAADKMNMDEVGTDTTKHRVKAVADAAKSVMRLFQLTGEGDGKMNMHLTACITTCSNGRYQDPNNNIQGACAPMLVHTDKSKTADKEKIERARQRRGEMAGDSTGSDRFVRGIDIPGITVVTTKNGSMTQETMVDYVKHLINSLAPKEERNPKILFLDGHASRWSKQALMMMIDNCIFPFFFASHASVWTQPNDCGTNLRWHNCIEKSARVKRRTSGTPTVTYFNIIFCDAWRAFMELEREELRVTGTNTTTNSYRKSGVHPFDPFCDGWDQALATLGCMKSKSCPQYEPVAKMNARTLTMGEKKTLREDIELDDDEDLNDIYVALIQAKRILGKWRQEVEEAVSNKEEGSKEYLTAISVIKPQPFSPAEIIAVELVDLVVVDVLNLPTPRKQTMDERAREITRNILSTTLVGEPVALTYYYSNTEIPNNTNANLEMKGSGVLQQSSTNQNREENIWHVTVRGQDGGNKYFDVKEAELLDFPFVINKSYNDVHPKQKTKHSGKLLRQQAARTRRQEKEFQELAKKKRQEQTRKEFDNLQQIFGENALYRYENFLEMVDRIRSPYSCMVEDEDGDIHEVTYNNEDNVAIMMGNSAIKVIQDILVSEKRKGDNNLETPLRKKSRHNEACNTTKGATVFDAIQGTCARNRKEIQKTNKKQLTSLKTEKKSHETIIAEVNKRKEQAPMDYWQVEDSSSMPVMKLFLRLFVPKCGVMTKKKDVVWPVIQKDIIAAGLLTRAQFDSRIEITNQRLSIIDMELGKLEPTEDVMEDVQMEAVDIIGRDEIEHPSIN